jgi:fatty acid desaturase
VAITDIKAFAHLTESDIESLGHELDVIRRDIEDSRGERDAAYIRRTIAVQRALEMAGRLTLFAGKRRGAWLLGTGLLAVAKIIENMELGHNISHGQWDWMNDPEIHSTTWEWDMTGPSAQWKTTHNYTHHTFTNVLGKDEDLGFNFLRMTRDAPWQPIHLVQPVSYLLLAAMFDWGIALHDWKVQREQAGVRRWEPSEHNRAFARKATRQLSKDFLIYPALTGRGFTRTLAANATANLIRNIWSNMVIFCGHFPDGAEKFTLEQLEHETRAEWYLRQMLGSANFAAGPAMSFMSGNLCHQIEHHLFPDLPSNRYLEIAERVRALCDKYDLPYTTGSLPRQYGLAFRTIVKLSVPNRFLRRTADDAPETSSERKFAGISRPSLPSWEGAGQWTEQHTPEWLRVDPATGKRRGLRSALAEAKLRLREQKHAARAALRAKKSQLRGTPEFAR